MWESVRKTHSSVRWPVILTACCYVINTGPWLADYWSRDLNNEFWLVVCLFLLLCHQIICLANDHRATGASSFIYSFAEHADCFAEIEHRLSENELLWVGYNMLSPGITEDIDPHSWSLKSSCRTHDSINELCPDLTSEPPFVNRSTIVTHINRYHGNYQCMMPPALLFTYTALLL